MPVQILEKILFSKFDENKNIARQGGTIAGNTRREIEAKTGKKIVSPQNAKQLKQTKRKKELE